MRVLMTFRKNNRQASARRAIELDSSRVPGNSARKYLSILTGKDPFYVGFNHEDSTETWLGDDV
jgi:hypothetical protein